MLAIEICKQLESHITEENREIIKGCYDLIRKDLKKNKLNLFNKPLTLKDFNEHFNNKLEASSYADNIFVKNGSFNIAFSPRDHVENHAHISIEEVKNGTTYRTIVSDKFTKTSAIDSTMSPRFKEQIGFSDVNKETAEINNLIKNLNLNVGQFVIDLLYSKDKNYTNKEIYDLVTISIPERQASSELVEVFIEHQSKFRDIINNKVENKLQQKPTM